MKPLLAAGHAEIRRAFLSGEQGGAATAQAQALLTDALVQGLIEIIAGRFFTTSNSTIAEQLVVIAIGGYGRGELAPYSDLDLLFLLSHKRTPWVEQVVETVLYILWDLGLKVGQAVRSVDECIRLARTDTTICTSLLEARLLWGDAALFADLSRRFAKEVISGSAAAFIEDKLAERDNRHSRMGDSRYMLEPNVKDGKGALRDLHALLWIAKYLYGVAHLTDLVMRKVLKPAEAASFTKAHNFLWTVRCHIHYLSGRAEERLTFDIQPEIAKLLGYAERSSARSIERFMKHYFLVARQVGTLSRIFIAYLEAETARPSFFSLRRLKFSRQPELDGFRLEGRTTGAAH